MMRLTNSAPMPRRRYGSPTSTLASHGVNSMRVSISCSIKLAPPRISVPSSATIPTFAQPPSPDSTPYPTPSIAAGTDPATATRAWLDTVPADKRAKSDAYFEGGYWLILWNFLVGSAISIFLLASRISARIRDFAERTTRFKALQVVLYAILFVLLTSVLE